MTAAIIRTSETSYGTSIKVLGMGANETQARKSAYTFLNRGFNDFGKPHAAGRAVPVSDKVAQAWASDDYNAWVHTASTLFLTDAGELDSTY